MLSREDVEATITALPGVVLDYPFGESAAVYKIGSEKPVKLSLKCDPQLAELLREKYETVVPGYHLNKKHWNTILCTGQVPDDELRDLIRHSYELVKD